MQLETRALQHARSAQPTVKLANPSTQYNNSQAMWKCLPAQHSQVGHPSHSCVAVNNFTPAELLLGVFSMSFQALQSRYEQTQAVLAGTHCMHPAQNPVLVHTAHAHRWHIGRR